jgi:hypothetical protein
MHCDTLQVFTQGQRGEQGGRTRGGVLGLGLLMGAATFAFGSARGCRKAEILAINGEPGDDIQTAAVAALQCIARLKHGCTARPVTSHAALPPRPACPPRADDDAWHERLVRYYSRFGFRPVRVVRGDSLGDLPHMLVWGGAGTRMDADVEGMLRRWTAAIRRNSPAASTAVARGPAAAAAAVEQAGE